MISQVVIANSRQNGVYQEQLPNSVLVNDIVGGQGHQERGGSEGHDDGGHVIDQFGRVQDADWPESEVEGYDVHVDQRYYDVVNYGGTDVDIQVVHHKDQPQDYCEDYQTSFQQKLAPKHINEVATN